MLLTPLSKINFGKSSHVKIELPDEIRRFKHENYIYISDKDHMTDHGTIVNARIPGTGLGDQISITLPECEKNQPLDILLAPKSNKESKPLPQHIQHPPKSIKQLFEKNNSEYFPGDDQLLWLYEISSFVDHDLKPALEVVEVGGNHDRNTLSWQTPLHYIACNYEKVRENYSDITDKIALFNLFKNSKSYLNNIYPLPENYPKMTIDHAIDYKNYLQLSRLSTDHQEPTMIKFLEKILKQNWNIIFNLAPHIGLTRENRSFQTLLNLIAPTIDTWLYRNAPELLNKFSKTKQYDLDEELVTILERVLNHVKLIRDPFATNFAYVGEQTINALKREKFLCKNGVLSTQKINEKTKKTCVIRFLQSENIMQSNTEIATLFHDREEFRIYHYGNYTITLHVPGTTK